MWNSLPGHLRQASSLRSFKSQVRCHISPEQVDFSHCVLVKQDVLIIYLFVYIYDIYLYL